MLPRTTLLAVTASDRQAVLDEMHRTRYGDLRCAVCGYGVLVGSAHERCPTCRATARERQAYVIWSKRPRRPAGGEGEGTSPPAGSA